MSAVCTKKRRSGSTSALGGGRSPLRYETVSGAHAARALAGKGSYAPKQCCDPDCLVVALTMGTSALVFLSCSRCRCAVDRRMFSSLFPFVLFQFSGLLFVAFVSFLHGRLVFGGSVLVLVFVSWLSRWPRGGVGCGVVLALRAFVVSAVVFVKLVCGVSVDFAVCWSFYRFCGIFEVAERPPGGEICGV